MDLKQILFLIIAIGLSVLSMYRKAKKQKQQTHPLPSDEESYDDFPSQPDFFDSPEPVVIFDPYDVTKSQQNFNINPKKEKKRQKRENIETVNFQVDNSKNNLQNADLESDIILLEDFEGTELQKAFLYSEIFKSVKN